MAWRKRLLRIESFFFPVASCLLLFLFPPSLGQLESGSFKLVVHPDLGESFTKLPVLTSFRRHQREGPPPLGLPHCRRASLCEWQLRRTYCDPFNSYQGLPTAMAVMHPSHSGISGQPDVPQNRGAQLAESEHHYFGRLGSILSLLIGLIYPQILIRSQVD